MCGLLGLPRSTILAKDGTRIGTENISLYEKYVAYLVAYSRLEIALAGIALKKLKSVVRALSGHVVGHT